MTAGVGIQVDTLSVKVAVPEMKKSASGAFKQPGKPHQTTLTATQMLNAQGTRSEKESVPRQDGAGRAGHG
ncbi:hypothetical protein CIL06_16710 [Pantoea vagans]|nr:hypothetical protein CIL06_16710 [Pantoea vagans]